MVTPKAVSLSVLVFSVALTLVGAGTLGWWLGNDSGSAGSNSTERRVEPPSPQDLVASGAEVEASLGVELVPGKPKSLAVLSSIDDSANCGSFAGMTFEWAPRRTVQVFSYDSGLRSWMDVFDSGLWPPRLPLIDNPASRPIKDPSVGDIAAGRAHCLARRDVKVQAVRMRSDRDYLIVQTFFNSGIGTGTGQLSVVGWLEGARTLLYQDSRVGPVSGEVAGTNLVTRSNLYLRSNANCCPSGELETVISWDAETNRIAVASPKALPFCTEGSVSKIDYAWVTEGTTGANSPFVYPVEYYVDVECSRAGPQGSYQAHTTFTMGDLRWHACLSVGDKVKIVSWTASDVPSGLGLEYYVTRGRPESAPSKLRVTEITRIP